MSDQFQDLLNAMIRSRLPELNAALIGAIRSEGLDPMGNVASGSKTIGSIPMIFFSIDAVASYSLRNFTGLSSLGITSLAVTSATSTPDGSALRGTVSLQAKLNSDLRMQVGGEFKAAGFISVGIGGSVTMSAASINATGYFDATVTDQLCLTRMVIDNAGLNYGSLNIDIDGLGIFNRFMDPLKDFILGQVKGPIISLIERKVTPVVNSGLNSILPQCASLA